MDREKETTETTERTEAPRVPGVLELALIAEIDAGLARLGITRDGLLAEDEIYADTREQRDAYDSFSLSVAFRARAVELLGALIGDGFGTCIEWNDEWIAELREVLPGAAGKPSPALVRQLTQAREKADQEDQVFLAEVSARGVAALAKERDAQSR